MAVGAFVSVGKVGATHRHVVRCGGESADGDSGYGVSFIGVRTGRAFVARGNEDGDTLRHRLLIQRVNVGVEGRARSGLGLTITDADNSRRRAAGVKQVLQGNEAAEVGFGVRTGRQLDGRAGSPRARPFHIEGRFAIVTVGAWISAVIRGTAGWVDLRQRAKGVR